MYSNATGVTSEVFGLSAGYFIPELEAFYEVLKSGKADKTEKQIKAPVYVLDATIKAYTENKEMVLKNF